jgi:hypothetical protein
VQVNNNKEKARIFAKLFFLPPPPAPDNHEHFDYPEPLPDPPQVGVCQIQRHIAKLSPYKAHGLDGIPNIVLQECVDNIISRLTCIFRAIVAQNLYYEPWKEITSAQEARQAKLQGAQSTLTHHFYLHHG